MSIFNNNKIKWNEEIQGVPLLLLWLFSLLRSMICILTMKSLGKTTKKFNIYFHDRSIETPCITLYHLGCTLVASWLETNHCIATLSDLLLREVALVLGGHLWSQSWTSVLRMVLSGSTWSQDVSIKIYFKNIPTKREDAEGDLRDVSCLEQI